ncbi:MAG: 4-hydroxy-tetrahydrodipicolinate synthase [Helicobacter sp.]|nr:4-hydroxy-tetrahydrodipicolinate synthase [Helicobacter sp.]
MQNIVSSALITPFLNNKVDYQTYEYLIKRQIAQGMNAIVPAGTTGESATLSHDEHKSCIEVALSAVKNTGAKVIAGAGSNSTKEATDLAIFAQKCGADAILCVTPYYNKPTQKGLYEHYKAIANAIEIPLILYNVPSRTNIFIDPSTSISLFRDVPNIIAIKEAHNNFDLIVELNAKCPDLQILSGEDALNYPILASGGSGLISVTGNLLPNKISQIAKLSFSGDFKAAKAINDELFDINKVLFCESNPIPIKAAMYLKGLIKSLEYRLPLVAPSSANISLIEQTLEKYEVLK